ncbi:probable indole-3-pyruvate monooxygenase YUCCA4 [Impatiens glandulifera]|uniref:probable indole-3-pyruvate monooxygenase YUCCA4 n=1 Tax=Impatiens glandulifera TaxID=253017 RepID=UPI001FB0B458|nr:probable indole-3-pyruvate monooxygenase YUCCA4 [Impatiens glandulifera]
MGSLKEEENQTNIQWVKGPIIIGAGPSGLAVSACLKNIGIPTLILERDDCIASLWKKKTYDRLKLHLPKKFCQLPFLNFPKTFPKYPTKKQFISYLESYATHFSISPKFNQEVQNAEFDSKFGVWRVKTQDSEYVSRWLIVAAGENAEPAVPDIQGIENFEGNVIHTSGYSSGLDFKGKRILVVGCGNSGMEVSLDLCRFNAIPHMVVRNTVHVLPREMFGFSTFGIAMTILKWLPIRIVDKFLLLMSNVILGNTERLGLKRPKTGPLELKNATGKTPVLDVGALSHIKSGKIKVMEGVREITRNGAKFVDGQEREFDSIIFATGYKSNVLCWLKGSDLFTNEGRPMMPFADCWKGEKRLYCVGFNGKGLLGSVSNSINIANDIADQWRMSKDCMEKFTC